LEQNFDYTIFLHLNDVLSILFNQIVYRSHI